MINERKTMNEAASLLPRGSAGIVWLRRLMPLVVVGVLLLLLSQVQRDTAFTLDQTRPLVVLVAVVLGAVAIWGLLTVGRSLLLNYHQLAWRMSFRVVGWIGIAASAVGLAFLLLSRDSDPRSFPIAGAVRAVEAVVPLVVGIQAAFLFAPDDEPAMEVMAACPRRLSWILLERLVVLLVMQIVVGLVGMIVSMAISGETNVVIMLVRWISPLWLLSGIAAYTTVRSRQPAFSVLVVGLLWFVCSFMGVVLLPGAPTFWPLSLLQPFLWPFHLYLQPGMLSTSDYWLNRVIIATAGVGLLLLTARQLRDVEMVVMGIRSKQSSKGG